MPWENNKYQKRLSAQDVPWDYQRKPSDSFREFTDKKYGKKDGMRNLCLHAYKVIFTHPITKEKIVIEAKMPKYMNIKKES